MTVARAGLTVIAAALALPAGASAATISLDRECYVSGQPGTVSLAGFAPNAAVTVASPDLGSTQVTTDATGSAAVPVSPPAGDDLKDPGSRAIVFTATEAATPAVSARTTGRIAPLAFATDDQTRTPKAPRAWSFSGWTPGKPLYAHFRFRGRTRGTYRFGVATGPCGEYRRRAPGIAVKGSVPTGVWTIQVDQVKAYRATTKPALRDDTVVFNRFSPRGQAGAAALSTATPTGSQPVW